MNVQRSLTLTYGLENIVRQILDDSETGPIIIQGDHGKKGENRSKILNLYNFLDQDYSVLYPSITPVNSFRIVLNQFFEFDYPFKEDTVIPLDGIIG